MTKKQDVIDALARVGLVPRRTAAERTGRHAGGNIPAVLAAAGVRQMRVTFPDWRKPLVLWCAEDLARVPRKRGAPEELDVPARKAQRPAVTNTDTELRELLCAVGMLQETVRGLVARSPAAPPTEAPPPLVCNGCSRLHNPFVIRRGGTEPPYCLAYDERLKRHRHTDRVLRLTDCKAYDGP